MNEDEIVADYIRLESLNAVRKKHNCSESLVKRVLRKHNINFLTRDQWCNKYNKLDTQIINMYINKKFESNKIAELLNISRGTVNNILNKTNTKKHFDKRYASKIIEKNKDAIITQYKQIRNFEALAREYNVGPNCISRFLKKSGIECKTSIIHLYTYEEILEMKNVQIRENISIEQLAQKYNRSVSVIRNNFIKYNIDWIRLTYKTYKLPSGRQIKLQGYETNFLDYIFNNKILEEAEIVSKPRRIPYIENNKPRWYYPDFYIPKFNLIVETKSSYVLESIQTPENALLKKIATIKSGYNYIMIINNNFNEFNTLLNFLQ